MPRLEGEEYDDRDQREGDDRVSQRVEEGNTAAENRLQQVRPHPGRHTV